jgi:hypothetical protein
MANIISIIPKRHLATYKVSERINIRACGFYDYKVFIELDDGKIRVLSADESDIDGRTAQELIDHYDGEGIRSFDDNVVTMNDFNEFVRALQSEGDSPMDAIDSVLFTLKESGCQCSGDVEKLIENVYPNIP